MPGEEHEARPLINFIALLFLQFISCFEVRFENHIFYEKVSSIKMMMIIIIHCTHYHHSDWPRAPCLF